MEKKATLKELLLGLEKNLRQVELADRRVKASEAKPLDRFYAIENWERARKAVEHYNKRVEEYSGGTIIEVTGEAWDNFKDLEVPKPFTMYLNCIDEAEAKLLLEVQHTQVPDFPIIWETLKYRTIKMKTLLF